MMYDNLYRRLKMLVRAKQALSRLRFGLLLELHQQRFKPVGPDDPRVLGTFQRKVTDTVRDDVHDTPVIVGEVKMIVETDLPAVVCHKHRVHNDATARC